MAIVQVIDYGPGQGKTYIDDDCVVKTEEEVQQILDTCQKIWMQALMQQYLTGGQSHEQERQSTEGSYQSSAGYHRISG